MHGAIERRRRCLGVITALFTIHSAVALAAEEADEPIVWPEDVRFEDVDSTTEGVDDSEAVEESATEVEETDAFEGDEDEPIEQMFVIGIQRSLEEALEQKRRTVNLTESINADEIGQLPDENVAEVLENIPGVQITRSSGIGEGVSVRGSDENRVEINGRGTLTDGDDRGGIRFSDLPAALVRSLTVVKVPTADMVEGSIGGTINVKTYRGLKLKEPLFVGRWNSEYADNSEAWNENVSATMGDKFETPLGAVGAILTVSYFNKEVREDSLRVSPANRQSAPPGIPASSFPNLDGDPGTFDPYFYPGFSDTSYATSERENVTVSGSLEWQATEKWKFFTEGTFTHVDNEELVQSAFASYGGGSPPSDRELDGLADARFGFADVGAVRYPILLSGVIGGGIRNGVIDSPTSTGPTDGLQIRTSNRNLGRESNSYVLAFGGEWLDDEWTVEFEVNASAAQRTDNSFISTWQYNDPTTSGDFHSLDARVRVPFIYSSRRGNLAYGPLPRTPAAANLLNPAYYSLFLGRDQVTRFDNDAYAEKIDVERLVDVPVLESVKFGLRFSQRSTERQRRALATDTFAPRIAGNDIPGLMMRTPGDLFDFNSDESYLRDFLTLGFDRAGFLRSQLITSGQLGANNLSGPQGFKVEEYTSAAYLRLDYETDLLPWPIKGNVGLRFIHTDQTSEGTQASNTSTTPTFTPVSVKQSYVNWLPSASMVIAPQEDVQIRLGVAKILRRPSFNQLAPTFEFPLNAGQGVRIGDPNLRPTTAVQMDVGLEWYFMKGSVISVGYFFKDLDEVIGNEVRLDAICNPIAVGDFTPPLCLGGARPLVDEIRWVNLKGGEIQGVEVAIQHNATWLPKPFHGLGVTANYAYQDGDRDSTFTIPAAFRTPGNTEGPLNFRRLSEHSYNVTVFYQRPRYRWSWRLRYTWRSSYLIEESSDVANGQPLYRDDRGQLNASTSYRITRLEDPVTVTLFFQGVNLTKSRNAETSLFDTGPLVRVRDTDRRLTIGASARF
ncbi:MAG: TonB-dependent receptor [Myxococcota bacterium]